MKTNAGFVYKALKKLVLVQDIMFRVEKDEHFYCKNGSKKPHVTNFSRLENDLINLDVRNDEVFIVLKVVCHLTVVVVC